ncbi:RNA-binding protein [Pleurocapsa sp. CCALA 161]|uniref:Jag family protein n=1 Tax=Pleurocapsa sp. CCALA 161 TaxID=2107688 RepID=UPI000D05CBA7|nr:R3H domain-containing nucleic acid-binding protein [Pleurocapsa sp. CCALA 161]PSB05664.1 RNA-binding protein [Pleurocapsa sp. CCALA 161]
MKSQLSSGKEWLEQLLTLMGVAAEVKTEGFETVTADSDFNWLSISVNDLTETQKQQLIGNKGESIDAIQYLTNTILNLDADPEVQSSFIVELDGYRVQRNQELATLTQDAIAQVQSTGEEVAIPGLSSAERKQIHSLLESTAGLSSESRGQEPNRQLVILPQ